MHHELQGIAVGAKPNLLRSEMVDEYISIPEDVALNDKNWLLRKHGIFCGNSTGANISAIKKYTKKH